MPPLIDDIFYLLGNLIRALGFLAIGYGLARFTMDAFNKTVWQVQIALALGFFGLLIALTKFASAGSAGAFALGAGIALLVLNRPDKAEEEETPRKK
jgi:hypothetical protein